MKMFSRKENAAITILYDIGLIGMFLVIALICAGRYSHELDKKQITYMDTTSFWTLDKDGTKPVDFKALGTYMNPEIGQLSIYYQLPVMDTDSALIFRSKDVYTRVLIGEDIFYETTVFESRFYNRSPGNLWNVVPISDKYSSKTIEIQIFMVYDVNAVTVDSLYFGDKADIILGLIDKNMFGILISIVLILFGFIIIVFDLMPTYAHTKKHHGLFWVGTFALTFGIWSMIETNMLQFAMKDMRILQLIDNMIMIIGSMPLWLYIDCEYKIFRHRAMRIMAYVDVAYILICVVVQLSGIADLHKMLNGAIFLMVIFDMTLLAWIIYFLIKTKREHKPILNCALQLLGLCSLVACTFFEVNRSLFHVDQIDRAGLMRIGMLILSICFATSSQLNTYRVLEQGLKYDLVSKLAYSDGLTGLGNRTAYLEQLEEYIGNAKEFEQIGIVYLDVNNLKKVNDNQGHEVGDQLIKVTAKIVQDSFGKFGKSFRIGGDEFCVLIDGQKPEEIYQAALLNFRQLVDEADKAAEYPFAVQIAHGFSVCREFTKEKLDEAVAKADSEMYKNKVMLKSNTPQSRNKNNYKGLD